MRIKIYEDRDVFQDTESKGIVGENKVETLKFEYPEEYKGLDMTIEMKDGDWLVVDDIQNDEYVLKTNVTSHKNISAQIVFTDDTDNVVFKSEIFEMNFKDALNAVEPLDDTDAKAEEILIGKKAYVQSEKITGTMADNGELNYTPTTEAQIIPEGYTSGGIIGAVSSDIDSNIIPTNIRAGITVLGIEGNLEPDKPDQNKTVTPTTQTQTITADTGYELAQVTVEGVTSAIDNNIQQGNIKKDISILGVTGTYEPTLQTKSITITQNGDTIVTPDSGYDGLQQVNITTNVGGPEFNTLSDIQNYINGQFQIVEDSIQNKVNQYPVYTEEPITLYKPMANANTYVIHKTSNDKYRIIWTVYPYVKVTGNSNINYNAVIFEPKYSGTKVYYTDWYSTLSSSGKMTFAAKYSNTFNTIDELITAISSPNGNITYTIADNASFTIKLDSPNYITYTNTIIFDEFQYSPTYKQILGSKRISQNETIASL